MIITKSLQLRYFSVVFTILLISCSSNDSDSEEGHIELERPDCQIVSESFIQDYGNGYMDEQYFLYHYENSKISRIDEFNDSIYYGSIAFDYRNGLLVEISSYDTLTQNKQNRATLTYAGDRLMSFQTYDGFFRYDYTYTPQGHLKLFSVTLDGQTSVFNVETDNRGNPTRVWFDVKYLGLTYTLEETYIYDNKLNPTYKFGNFDRGYGFSSLNYFAQNNAIYIEQTINGQFDYSYEGENMEYTDLNLLSKLEGYITEDYDLESPTRIIKAFTYKCD